MFAKRRNLSLYRGKFLRRHFPVVKCVGCFVNATNCGDNGLKG